jgi:hypothetical protein
MFRETNDRSIFTDIMINYIFKKVVIHDCVSNMRRKIIKNFGNENKIILIALLNSSKRQINLNVIMSIVFECNFLCSIKWDKQ